MNSNEQPTRGYGPLFDSQRPQPAPKLAQETVEDFWADATVISMYTRAQALADGVLEDASTLAKEAGFTVPVAVTCSLWDRWIDPGEMGNGQSLNGRLWDTLQCLRRTIKTTPVGEDTIRFRCVYVMGAQSKLVTLKAICGPGDQGEPVITVMLPEED